MRVMCVPRKQSVPLANIAKGTIAFLDKETGTKSIAMATT